MTSKLTSLDALQTLARACERAQVDGSASDWALISIALQLSNSQVSINQLTGKATVTEREH